MAKPIRLSKVDIDNNTVMYDKYHHDHKMQDGWLPGSKEKNFRLMAKIVDFTGVRIRGARCLDVGCGSGDLSEFLHQRGTRSYLGLDIYEPSLTKARLKYPDETFIEADFLSYDFEDTFDYIFSSGSMTVKQKDVDNYAFLEAMAAKMWGLATIGVVFNVLTDTDRIYDHDLFYYSQERVSTLAKTIAPDASLVIEKTPRVHQMHVYLYRNTK